MWNCGSLLKFYWDSQKSWVGGQTNVRHWWTFNLFIFFYIWKIHKVVYELSQLFKFNSIKNLFIFSFFFLFFFFNKPSLIFSFRFSFNRKVDLKQKTIIHKQAYELLGLIQNNSNINSFTSLYMLAKYNYYTYFNNDMANMRPLLIILIFSFL